MSNASRDLDQMKQVASQNVFVDLQAYLQREFGQERTSRGSDVCSRFFQPGDAAGGEGQGRLGVGQATFTLWRKGPHIILPGFFLALDDMFQRYGDSEWNDDWEECAVTEALNSRVQVVHLELTDGGGLPSGKWKRTEACPAASKAEEIDWPPR